MKVIGESEIEALLERMAGEIETLFGARLAEVAMVGIHTGGLWVAERLHRRLGLGLPLGSLNISFYRDDFSRIGLHPQVRPSHLPAAVEGERVLLVDDVLFTGRTLRAAMNEIFDYGRPHSVNLAVLVDRGGRELPVAADVTGTRLPLDPDQHVKLSGPSPLLLQITP